MRNEEKVQRLVFEILRILNEKKYEGPVGARTIARELGGRGFEIGERAVRYHLKLLDERGFTEKPSPRAGRIITEEGVEEISDFLVSGRVGFIIGKIEELIYKMSYDLETGMGTVVVNLSLLAPEELEKTLGVMEKVIERRYAPSPLIKVAHEDERIGGVRVPRGKVGIATVCSVTIDGLLVKAGIPASPKFGGVLEIEGGKPKRFTDAIMYQGCSLDPLDVFASRKMTSYLNVIEAGTGRILANLREIPMLARGSAQDIINQAETNDINGVLDVGAPGEPLYELSVDVNQVGIVVAGGINPMTAAEESGVVIKTNPMELTLDISEMEHIREYM